VQPEPLTAKQIQDELIDENTMLLEYALGEPKSHLLIVQKNGVQSYDIAGRAQIESAARRVYRELTFPNQLDGRNGARAQELLSRAGHEFEEAARTLSRMVLEPAAKELGNKRLLIVSDGALHYIPFAALPVRASDTSFVPLVAEHEIVNLPSASVLAVLRDQEIRRTKPTKTVAVLADPVFDALDPRVPDQASRPNATAALPMNTRMLSPGNDSMSKMMRSVADIRGIQPGSSRSARDLHLSRLWFTRVEADRILAATPKGQGSEIVDFDANRAAATSDKLSEYRIVHFATHGLLDSRNPELSGLVFSMVDKQGRTQDGFLDLQDIYNLNLPADMVVLSACETGLGKEIDGEGMIGLTRGFMYAGASRVVASLWRVSDIATAELMSRFYQAMERDGMRPAAALRHAQVEMWKERRWKMPYYWAAFQIHGEWN